MDQVLLEEWVREMDKKFVSEGRKVDLVIDSCPAYPQIGNLKLIKLFLFPPNRTSQTLPMDRGVIRSVKAQHRKDAVCKIIQSVEKEKKSSKIYFGNTNPY